MEENPDLSDLSQDPVVNHSPAGSPPEPTSTSGRIMIKLKMPHNLKTRHCSFCDRSFSSGKALGGHISSAHVQANRDHSSRKLKMKTATDVSASSNDAAEIPCSECGKIFPTMKSLYGHMRCHPERTYRGMNSPRIGLATPNFSNLGVKVKLKADAAGSRSKGKTPVEGPDPDREIKTWLKTGKRGRVEVSGFSSSREEEEAFDALMMLRRCQVRPSQTNRNQDNESSSSNKKKKKLLEAAGEAIVIDEGDEICASAIIQLTQGADLSSESTSPNQIQIMEPLSSSEETCLSAMVELMKGTQLGSSPTNPNEIQIGTKPQEPSPDPHGSHLSIHKMQTKIINTADKGDESGKALSEHLKKAHIKKDRNGEGSSEVTNKVRRDFDLNKIPEEEEEDE